jgi:hypothetical protein
MPKTPKHRKDLCRRSERGPNHWIFSWNGHGCMYVYHVLENLKEKREWWDSKTSSIETWILWNVPCATMVKGNSFVVGPENKVNRNFGFWGL